MDARKLDRGDGPGRILFRRPSAGLTDVVAAPHCAVLYRQLRWYCILVQAKARRSIQKGKLTSIQRQAYAEVQRFGVLLIPQRGHVVFIVE